MIFIPASIFVVRSVEREIEDKKKEIARREQIEKLAAALEISNTKLETVNAALKTTNAKLDKANKDLEIVNAKLATVNAALKTTNAALDKANNDKSEFISFASHEIRNPLTSITGYASNILEGDYGPVNAEQKDAMQKILVRSTDAVALIGEYLNKSKMELDKID